MDQHLECAAANEKRGCGFTIAKGQNSRAIMFE
jgi:hypothetical protein